MRQITVLCIEDEPDMIDLVKLALERGGFRAIGALGGREGLDVARRVRPDVVLLDLMMPDLNGWEVARRMQADESLENVRVVVLSALSRNSHDTRELEVVDAYVEKPFAPNHLLNEIRQTLDSAA